MCGLVGLLGGPAGREAARGHAALEAMATRITHRGPDDVGYWQDPAAEIGLGHRRLSILDLSPAGHQPMVSASGRYVIAFNGEIYNHVALREELSVRADVASAANAGAVASAPPLWRGHSDTETLLGGFDAWGIHATVLRAIGMFAFAVWDRDTRTLTLARDRLGEKPLYYGWQGEGRDAVFLFGSELGALRAGPSFDGRIDRGALCLLLRHNYVPAPYAIYAGIRKLPAGCLLTVSLHAREPVIRAYWSAVDVARESVACPFTGTEQEAVDELEALLGDSVRRQMVADVPLGAFLSGGVDSSTVVALMQAQSSRPVHTFSIGFHEEAYNEAAHARAVAAHLGTHHTELLVSPREALDVIPRLPALYSEPFSDSSQVPTFLVAQLARSDVTVSLSGDAGDELFCGYTRYTATARIWRALSRVPGPLRRVAAGAVTAVPPGAWNAAWGPIRALVPARVRAQNIGDKLHKAAGVLPSRSVDELYLGLVSHWPDPAGVVVDGAEPPTLLTLGPDLATLGAVERMMVLDAVTYLSDDILVKVDRAAMGVSLETRVPFLDHRVVEFAWRLPLSMKLRDGQSKWALRHVLYRHVPRALIERPKMGFGVPLDTWLRGPLRDWAEGLLDEGRLRREGFFKPEPVRAKWSEHLSGRRNWQHHLWDVLMFQAWFEHARLAP